MWNRINISNNDQPHEMKNTKQNSKSERHRDLRENPKSGKNRRLEKLRINPINIEVFTELDQRDYNKLK